MSRSRRNQLRELDRSAVQLVARIFGSGSAAARALADADRHPGPVKFWQAPGSIVVEKLPVEDVGESDE